jgi:hypothetical protein
VIVPFVFMQSSISGVHHRALGFYD